MKNNYLANVAMVIVVLFWGYSFVSIKIVVSVVPPITMAFLRFLIASLILWMVLKKWEPGAKLKKGDIFVMGLSGFLGITLYFFFENTGIKLSNASNAALITSIIPILATTLDIWLYKTKVSIVQYIGLGLAMIGSYLAITANGQVLFGSIHFKGNLLIVLAMVSWVLYTLYKNQLEPSIRV